MCLTNIEKITPQEDIICYKLFRVDPNECDSDMWSPYQYKSWKIGRMEALKRNEPTVYSSGYKKYAILGGAYHSYQNTTDIPVEFLYRSEFVVCKCIIPKSSKYVYSGYNNENENSKVEYKNNYTKVCIICPKHGEFWQFANGHLTGRGCPHCKNSLLENEVRNFLDKEGIKYIAQKRAKWLGKQSLDFYLPEFGTIIECQGKQHFVPSQYFGGEERFKKTLILDRTKRKLCEERNLKILYYTHCKYNYDYELITDLETLKNKIYENKNV